MVGLNPPLLPLQVIKGVKGVSSLAAKLGRKINALVQVEQSAGMNAEVLLLC